MRSGKNGLRGRKRDDPDSAILTRLAALPGLLVGTAGARASNC